MCTRAGPCTRSPAWAVGRRTSPASPSTGTRTMAPSSCAGSACSHLPENAPAAAPGACPGFAR
eukprot:15127360-Heterocapsa_arctica.AAC.1